jgi:hypothetical protein
LAQWFRRRSLKCKTFTDDGRQVMAIVPMDLWSRWTKTTRCVGTTRMSLLWILRTLANVSPFFNSLSNRPIITNYCLRSVSSSLLKFTRFIQGNNIASTNLDMARNLQYLHMNKKSYTYKTLSVTQHCNSKYQKSSQYLKA